MPSRKRGLSVGLTHRRYCEADSIERLIPAQLQPPLCGVEPVHHVEALEWVIEVAFAGSPVDELNGELIRGVARRHPVLFVEPKEVEKQLESAECSFSDANGLYARGFQDRDGFQTRQRAFQIGGRHPSGSTSSHDYDLSLHDLCVCATMF